MINPSNDYFKLFTSLKGCKDKYQQDIFASYQTIVYLSEIHSDERIPLFFSFLSSKLPEQHSNKEGKTLIGLGKSTAISEWISAHKTNRFMVIVLSVNIEKELYTKLFQLVQIEYETFSDYIPLCFNERAFSEFSKAAYNHVNVIITIYSTPSICKGDLFEE